MKTWLIKQKWLWHRHQSSEHTEITTYTHIILRYQSAFNYYDMGLNYVINSYLN